MSDLEREVGEMLTAEYLRISAELSRPLIDGDGTGEPRGILAWTPPAAEDGA